MTASRVANVLWVGILLGTIMTNPALPADDDVDTFMVRYRTATPGRAGDVTTLLERLGVGERFCENGRCTVLCRTRAEVETIESLRANDDIEVEPIIDAHRIFLRGATYDAKGRRFDRDLGVNDSQAPPLPTRGSSFSSSSTTLLSS